MIGGPFGLVVRMMALIVLVAFTLTWTPATTTQEMLRLSIAGLVALLVTVPVSWD